MQRPVSDLRDLVDAVEIHSATTFSIGEERFNASAANDAPVDLASTLASALYSRKYCRPIPTSFTPIAPDPRVARVFVEHLSHANCGSGTWESGWMIQAIEADGTLVARRQRDGLLVWARPEEFRPANGVTGVGSAGRVRVPKELREMLPGYYAAFGDADRSADVGSRPVDLVRFYWHLTSDVARDWIRELTTRFNAAAVPFQVKVLNDPAAYLRADAAVLYVERKDLAPTMALLPALHRVTRDGLRTTTPMLTKRLAPGLSAADDPGDGRSFGQHRCQLIAEGLIRAAGSPASRFETRLKAVVDRFADEGLTGAAPWLKAGSADVYQWSSPGRVPRSAGRRIHDRHATRP
jgi:hypothetical protein